MRKKKGQPYPLGATWDGQGVNFALFSEHATGVDLCLFDGVESSRESHRIPLTNCTDHVWHLYLPRIRPGCLYGYRVRGLYKPSEGHRFNPFKILLDPYARCVVRTDLHDDRMFPYRMASPSRDLEMDRRDNAACAPLGVVVESAFDWGDDRPPEIPWNQTIIYETHVKGMTALHPQVPKNLRGTYSGLCSEPVLAHLKSLGVTAVQLMPVHQHRGENHLVEKGLSNYWGYSTLAYFAPDSRYGSGEFGDLVPEFKRMVRSFHTAGLEVILDVVYNHTVEGNHLGPILSFRGIDNRAYYRLNPHDPGTYQDFTGCGNTLNTTHPRVLQLVTDSLRYWVTEMHVDGFRFDLASALLRADLHIDLQSPFLTVLAQDPVLSQVKLIAEPWDLGEDGYLVGKFPIQWSELNGPYRDTVRRFWKGDPGVVPELASRLTGSSDLYQNDGRKPRASINFLTSHDGFTLHDLVSYNDKHNERNLEENRDGSNANYSWNCGHEGPTSRSKVRALRSLQKRNLMATLMLSQGVPFISGGDELGRTQSGNNNPYCLDDEINWTHWDLDRERKLFLEFCRKIIRLRKSHPVFQRNEFFDGKRVGKTRIKDIMWISTSGKEMTQKKWHAESLRCIGIRLSGDAVAEEDRGGKRRKVETLLILMNADKNKIPFVLPSYKKDARWEVLLDTKGHVRSPWRGPGEKTYSLDGHSLVIFKLER